MGNSLVSSCPFHEGSELDSHWQEGIPCATARTPGVASRHFEARIGRSQGSERVVRSCPLKRAVPGFLTGPKKHIAEAHERHTSRRPFDLNARQMKKPTDPRTDQIKPTEQQPTDPGPTHGVAGSEGRQPDEPGLEEKRSSEPKKDTRSEPQRTGHVARHGVAGSHRDRQAEARPEGSPGAASPASLQLDADSRGRVNTGTGDQPGNTGGSRTGMPSTSSPDTIAPQASDNTGSTAADLDQERSGGMSGGLGRSKA